jgi:hypothetical protein
MRLCFRQEAERVSLFNEMFDYILYWVHIPPPICGSRRDDNIMPINVNVKHTFKIRGKEHKAIEEMPQDVRDIFENFIASWKNDGHGMPAATTRT